MRGRDPGGLRAALVAASLHRSPDPADPPLSAAGARAFATAARLHGIAPAAYLWAGAAGLSDAVVQDLAGSHQAQVRRHLSICSDLDRFGRALDAAGIRWAVFKGPVLSTRYWPRPDLRTYVDLDLLVHARDLGLALEVAADIGARLDGVDWPLLAATLPGQVSLELPGGSLLDLHWDVVNDDRQRAVFGLATADLLADSVPVVVAGVTARTFDDVSTLLHLSYHMCHSGAHRLLWIRDVDASLATVQDRWAEVVARSRATGTALVLALAVQRAQAVYGDHGLGEQPAPGAWRWLCQAADWRWPPPVIAIDRPSGQVAYRSARRGDHDSARAFAARRLVSRRRPPTDAGGAPAEGGPRDVAVARTRYLAEAARADQRRARVSDR